MLLNTKWALHKTINLLSGLNVTRSEIIKLDINSASSARPLLLKLWWQFIDEAHSKNRFKTPGVSILQRLQKRALFKSNKDMYGWCSKTFLVLILVLLPVGITLQILNVWNKLIEYSLLSQCLDHECVYL